MPKILDLGILEQYLLAKVKNCVIIKKIYGIEI